jgi:hypothetical protein
LVKLIKQYSFVAVSTALFALVFGAFGAERAALSCLLGGLFAILIQYFSITVTRAVLQKKSVAFAGFVIVFKYAIFGIILWFCLSNFELHPVSFLVGFLSLIPGLYLVGVIEFQERHKIVKVF